LIYALRAVQNNTFKGEIIVFDLQADGVGYSTTNPAMTQNIVSRIEDTKRQIVSGQIKVAATHAEARRLPGFPQNLRALDN